MAVGTIVHHSQHDVRDHLLQFADEGGSVVLVALYLSEFLFPDTCELGTLQQFLVNESDELDSRLCGSQALANPLDVVALEQRLDDGSSGGWASDAVLLQGIAQFIVLTSLPAVSMARSRVASV